MKCWGGNGSGQLGLGDTQPRGDGPEEMGDDLPVVDLGAGRTATEIAAGSFHVCARLDDGTVKCWGGNSAGQLGLGDVASRGGDPGEMGDDLPPVDLGAGRTAVHIRAGGTHVCTLLDDGSAKCWGGNGYGELGLGNVTSRGDGPGEMGDDLPPVDLGAGRTATEFAEGGANHTCALLDDGTVKCWGYNVDGELGLGDDQHRGDGPGEMGDDLPIAVLDASPTVTVAADETSVAAGDPIHVHIRVANPGDQALTGVVVAGGNAAACATTLAVLVPGSAQDVDCTHTTTGMDLPSFTATATVRSTQTPDSVASTPLDVPVSLSSSVGAIGGTVTETASGDPIAGGLVALLSPTDFSLVGSYGTATGTISEDGTGVPLEDVWVIAIDPAGKVRATTTDAAGAYSIAGLAPGAYRLRFVDPTGQHDSEYFQDVDGPDAATPRVVSAGEATSTDASLASAP